MRGVGRVLQRSDVGASLARMASFSTGSGRGRGRSAVPPRNHAIGRENKEEEEEQEAQNEPQPGRGHGVLLPQRQLNKPSGVQGRGQPLTGANDQGKPSASDSTPLSPFKAWQSDWEPLQPNPSVSIGRGRPISPGKSPEKGSESSVAPPQPPSGAARAPGKPVFLKRQEVVRLEEPATAASPEEPAAQVSRAIPRVAAGPPLEMAPGSLGYGRGKPLSPPSGQYKPLEENRHARPGKRTVRRAEARQQDKPTVAAATPKLLGEEAVKQALGILAKRAEETGTAGAGGRGRGGRGRGRGRGAVQGRGRGDRRTQKTAVDDDAGDLYLGDDADGDRLVKRIGEENWNKIAEAIDSVGDEILPDPVHRVFMDSLHTNFLLEFEPEYAMESFGKNPVLEEKPPIPLREFMEKMKPLLVAAEGIQSQEEWQELLEGALERAPVLKKIVDYYSGPDRITARQQKEKLENIASGLPSGVHPSVKNFTDRALLSLQSNPGWGFDKKLGFMDKLVREVSQYYEAK